MLFTDIEVVSGSTSFTRCTLPVYVAGVLCAFNHEEERKNLSSFLLDYMTLISLSHASLDTLKVTFNQLGLVCNEVSLMNIYATSTVIDLNIALFDYGSLLHSVCLT